MSTVSGSTNTNNVKKEIIVLGAGVVGLTTALTLQQTGKYHVTIVADILPSDPKSIRYTSSWAGAHHVYNALNGTGQHDYEEKTFEIMWAMSAPGSDSEECFLRIPQTEYFFEDRPSPEPLEKMPHFRYLNPDELISSPGAKFGMTFTTITIDTPIYLSYLFAKFLDEGGSILRGSVIHLYQVLEGGTSLFPGGSNLDPKPDAVIVCVGLGARFLGGVEDKSVYPIRGQTVLVRAPWVRFGRTETSEKGSTYIIPRRSSDVIVGGTRLVDDWYPQPRPETMQDILLRGLALCPELAPPDVRSTRRPTINDVLPLMVGEGCGLRPARKGGVRVELEWIDGAKVSRQGKVAVVHNYGHAGFGFQSSWGCALKALEILDNALLDTEVS